MTRPRSILPWFVLLLGVAVVGVSLRPPPQGQFHLNEFGRLPVLLNGRIQPLDSVARNSLLVIRTRQSVRVDGKSMPAIEWFAEVLMKPEMANTRKIFRIDNAELLDLLTLPREEKYFSFNDLAQPKPADAKEAKGGESKSRLDDLQREYERIIKTDEKNRTVFEKQLLKLATSLQLYDRLKNTLQPENVTNYVADLDRYQKVLGPGVEAVQNREAGKSFDQSAMDKLVPFVRHYELLSRTAYALMIPPSTHGKSGDGWENVGTSLLNSLHTGQIHPALRQYALMSTAYAQGNASEFNRAVAQYRLWLEEHGFVPELKKGRLEFFFNHFQPFINSIYLYVAAFLLAAFFWVTLSEWLRRSAFLLLVLALVVHTFGLVFRMYLEGRPPVTNLYSSAIFIGWGTAVLGLILERFYRDGIGIVTSSALGFITLLIAHNLATLSPTGDTMEMLRAVLDTNFWLATHVVTITIGYSATFMAGFLALIYILRGVFTKSLNQEKADAITRMVYGIICFATLFSFVGTVLGGIWADQSWGRFWGWDPKENGALLIVLWNAAILHARSGGYIQRRGLMNMAIFGNIVTSFSWFGVNMLGVGLHSYGFMEQAMFWLLAFILIQLNFIALGMLPEEVWTSLKAKVMPIGRAWFSFQGRMRRAEYWKWHLLLILVVIIDNILLVVGMKITPLLVLSGLIGMVSLWPGMALVVKRLHDRNRSGWLILTLFVPGLNIISGIWIAVEVAFLKGSTGVNRFGPDPLEVTATGTLPVPSETLRVQSQPTG